MSKNVYLDLGFSEDEAIERAIRAEIATRIEMLIADRRLTQKQAASLFHVPQPTISKIVNGRLANLSLAFLVRMLIRAGLPFEIRRGVSAEDVEVTINDAEVAVATKRDEFQVTGALPGTAAPSVLNSATQPMSATFSSDVTIIGA